MPVQSALAVRSEHGTGRYVASEDDIVLGTIGTWLQARRPLIYCHGSGDTAGSAFHKTGQGILLKRLARLFTVVACDLGGTATWGNDTVITRIGQAKTYLSSSWGATGPVVLVAGSMGALGALAYTLANPSNVLGVAAAIPALDLNDLVANNRGGAAAAINTAYGGTYSDGTHGPTHSPVQFAASLPAIPISLWTASDDAICVPATADAFVAARPATTRTDLGALGHTEAAITASVEGAVRFVEQFA